MDRQLEDQIPVSIKPKNDLETAYFDFLRDFREYLSEYIRDTVTELLASEVPVSGSIKLFTGVNRGKVRIKNQGKETCWISTNGKGGYRLDPGESVEFFLNNQLYATTCPGTITTIGFIKY